jgi:NF-X1-type zinc finger protein NFXL1
LLSKRNVYRYGTVRCHKQEYSCNRPCGRKLPCGHACDALCHPAGECPPCQLEAVHACRCGKAEKRRACADRDFGCGDVCGASLACGAHQCQRECHSRACGPCPGEGRLSCHCGKTPFTLSCGDPTPRCSNACDKLKPCGHTCQERCHEGNCEDTACMVMTAEKVVCACGSLEKSMPCHQRPLVGLYKLNPADP